MSDFLLGFMCGAVMTFSTMLYIFSSLPADMKPKKRMTLMMVIGLPLGVTLGQLAFMIGRMIV